MAFLNFITPPKSLFREGGAKLHFHRLNFSVPYTGAYMEFYDAYKISNSGYTFHLSHKSEPLGIFFDMDTILSYP